MSTRSVRDAEPPEREVRVEHASLKVLLRVLDERVHEVKNSVGARGWLMIALQGLTTEERLFALEEAEPVGLNLKDIEFALRWAVRSLNIHHIILREGEE